MKYITVFIVIVCCFNNLIVGQIQRESVPLSLIWDIRSEAPSEEVIASYPEMKLSEEKLPLVAGHTIPIDFNSETSGSWVELPDGSALWRMGIQIRDARAINVYLSDLRLSEGEELFIYSPDREKVIGAFTEQNNSDYFPTEFISGDQIIIEFNTRRKSRLIPFSIVEVGISAVHEVGSGRGFGDAGFCEVKINCPEGDNWQTEKRGVTRILVKESSTLFWCSGSLLNNTNKDGTPYLLTAYHCGENSTEIDYLGWLFYFNFESNDCEFPAFEPDHQSIEGAALLAHSATSTNSGSDFKLLLLNKTIPDDYRPYFNGWDWTGDGASQGVCIHHPEGDIKMVSTYEDPVVSTNYNNPTFDPEGKYWKVEWAETASGHGVTEGGSSGSPLFSEAGLIVGALSGGRASCGSPNLPDYYGKFSYSWASNGSDSARQLQPWLDPNNSGEQKLGGLDSDTSSFRALFSSNTTQIRIGENVEFFNQSEGNISGYEWYFPGGNPESSELEMPPPVSYESAGDFDVMLIASSDTKNDTLLRTDYIRVLPTLSPNPSSGKFKINFGQSLPDELDVKVIDMAGRNVNYFLYSEEENTITIDLSTQGSGVYLIKIKADGNEEVLKASLIRQNKED